MSRRCLGLRPAVPRRSVRTRLWPDPLSASAPRCHPRKAGTGKSPCEPGAAIDSEPWPFESACR